MVKNIFLCLGLSFAVCMPSPAQTAREAAEFKSHMQRLKSERQEKAMQGDSQAQFWMGLDQLKSDPEAAVAWFEKSASQNNSWALNSLAICYRDGTGVTRDIDMAIKLFEKASNYGDDEIRSAPCYNLGLLYLDTTHVQYDPKKAVAWLTKAAEYKHDRATFELACLYFESKHVAKNEPLFTKWCKLAAEQGHPTAQYLLGCLYQNGQFVEKDHQAALGWFRKAGSRGNADAQFMLGWLYANGESVAVDSTEAAKWYLKAAQSGHKSAMNNLGSALSKGVGVPKDPVAAAAWFRKTADLGDDCGMFNLGLCYLEGAGVPKDEVEAYGYINLAGATLEYARKAIQTIELNITPEMRARGQLRSREIQRRIDEGKQRDAELPDLLKVRPLDKAEKGA